MRLPGIGWHHIEASAGTGKTYTIERLYLEAVAERRLPVTSILVLSYTRAAANELKARLRKTLTVALAEGGDAMRVLALRLALARFDEAPVSTFHGFCQSVLQEFTFEAGIAAARLRDEEALPTGHILSEQWQRALASVPACGRAPGLTAHEVATQEPTLPELAGEAHTFFATSALTAGDPIDRSLLPVVYALSHSMTPALLHDYFKRADRSSREVVLAPLLPGLETESDLAPTLDWLSNTSIDDFLTAAARLRHFSEEGYSKSAVTALNKLKRALAFPVPGLGGKAPHAKAMEAKAFLRLDDSDPLRLALDSFARAEHAAAPHFARWLTRVETACVSAGKAQLRRYKEEGQFQVYADLIRDTREALNRPALAEALRTRFPIVIVDEFQDTDRVQTGILKRLFDKSRSTFILVGDPKQAIYGFRGSDIGAYLHARDADPAPLRLDTNWRSTPELIAAVGRLFSAGNAFKHDGIAFEPVRPCPEPRARLWSPDGEALPPMTALQCTVEDGAPIASQRRRIAQQSAAHIHALLRANMQLSAAPEGGPDAKPLRPGDITVLCRSRRELELMAAALAALGLPYQLKSNISLFETPEAALCEDLLAAALAVRDRAAATERLRLRLESLGAPPLELEAVAQGLRRFQPRLRGLGAAAALLGFMSGSAGEPSPAWLGALSSERRLVNVRHLAEALERVAREQGLGAHGLLRWLRLVRRDQAHARAIDREERMLRSESESDAVQLVTMHASKGLEYPVTYLPFVGLGNRSDNRRAPNVLELRDGESVQLITARHGATFEARSEAYLAGEASEGMRLLYVALTRAQAHCVLGVAESPNAFRSMLGQLLGMQEPPASPEAGSLSERLHALTIPSAHPPDDSAGPQPGDGLPSCAARGVPKPTEVGPAEPALAEPGPAAAAAEPNPARVPEALAARPHAAGAARTLPRVLLRQRTLSSYSGVLRALGESHFDLAAHGTPATRFSGSETDTGDATNLDGDLDHDPAFAGWDAELAQPDAASSLAPDTAPAFPTAHAPRRGRRAPTTQLSLDALPTLWPWANVPRGAEVGLAVHDLLEAYAAEGPAALAQAQVETRLKRHGADPALAGTLSAAVASALEGPSGPEGAPSLGHMLREGEVYTEVPFVLHNPNPTWLATWAERLSQHANPNLRAYSQRLATTPAVPSTFLHGFIDLVFIHNGAVYVADYKTNGLGETPDAYSEEALWAEMFRHDYPLQALIYTEAITQALAPPAGPLNFGATYYYFLRAMHPGTTTGLLTI